jgi:hypothetical protein
MCNIEDNFFSAIRTGQFRLALHWAHAFLTVARS